MNFEDIFEAQEEERKHEMTNNPMQTTSANAHLASAFRNVPTSENNKDTKINPAIAERLKSFQVGDQYEVVNLIGEGAYGTVW